MHTQDVVKASTHKKLGDISRFFIWEGKKHVGTFNVARPECSSFFSIQYTFVCANYHLLSILMALLLILAFIHAEWGDDRKSHCRTIINWQYNSKAITSKCPIIHGLFSCTTLVASNYSYSILLMFVCHFSGAFHIRSAYFSTSSTSLHWISYFGKINSSHKPHYYQIITYKSILYKRNKYLTNGL